MNDNVTFEQIREFIDNAYSILFLPRAHRVLNIIKL